MVPVTDCFYESTNISSVSEDWRVYYVIEHLVLMVPVMEINSLGPAIVALT